MDGLGSALNAQVREPVDADEELDVGPGLLVLAALGFRFLGLQIVTPSALIKEV